MTDTRNKTKGIVDPQTVTPPRRRMCATMEVHHRLLEQDSGFRTAQFELEGATSLIMGIYGQAERIGLVRIPVVVHVVYNSAAENISLTQIKSEISVLNKDFRAKNSDKKKTPECWRGLVADCQLEFFLATKDPKGKPSTGVTRTKTTKANFPADDSMKKKATGGADPWPSSRYLNIWVCNLAGGLLGYAQFPGGPAASDGVVIQYTAFGVKGKTLDPFNLGRTTTHEVGHWLNLRHIWGDTEDCTGTDFVADTPNAAGPNYGKPEFPHISCNNGPNGDMFVNYMDYVDDDTMVMFTPQQVVRMRAALDGPRKKIGVAG